MNEINPVIEDDLIPAYPSVEKGVWPILFAVGCLLLLGIGIPILLIYFIKSPPIDQILPIMGISFTKLVYIYLISAAIIVYISVLFLKATPAVIIPVFALSVYCCFPFIAGLRNNLSIKEAIVDTPLLSHVPFFLKPAYFFFEFLIPAGILFCLFLQIKGFFTTKRRSLAFLSLAFYLCTAAVLGFSILTQAGLPNLVSLAKWSKHNLSFKQGQQQIHPVEENRMPSPNAESVLAARALRLPATDKAETDLSDSSGIQLSMPVSKEAASMHEIDQKFQQLSTKLDHVIDIVNQKLTPQPNGQEQAGVTNVDNLPRHDDAVLLTPLAAQSSANKTEPTEDVEKKLLQVSARLTGIEETMSRIETMLPRQDANQQKTADSVQAPVVSVPQTQHPPNESLTDKGDDRESARELARISAKVDQIWEKLSQDKNPHKPLSKAQ